MLTYAATTIVAFRSEDDPTELYCEDCARNTFGTLAVARADARLQTGGVEGVIEYNADEVETYEIESLVDSWQSDSSSAPEGFDPENPWDFEIREPVLQCAGTCGRYYTGGAEPFQEWTDPENPPSRQPTSGDNRWHM